MGYLLKNEDDVCVADSKIVPGEKALVAQNHIAKNTIIFMFQSAATDVRTRTSIQVSECKHIEPGDFGAYANHSCSPNTQIVAHYDDENNVAEIVMLTIADIEAGDEITFDYATTETTVTDNLLRKPCLCGSANCRKFITGFQELSQKDKMHLISEELTAEYLHITD
ncbi:MAG: SET domain-containing protein-lysine N-methyltransferase [Bacteroidales bacterium]|nr:SET domain-containing protein-lysine N-methyltransferase [Bacteroidales bacterium]